MSEVVDWSFYVNAAFSEFHKRRCEKLSEMTASTIFLGKNPYLYRATCGNDIDRIVGTALKAFVASSDETLFGNVFFEQLTIAASNGRKSMTTGIDVEFERDGILHGVSVKSGTKVFNSSSKANQEKNFEKARKTLRTNNTSEILVQLIIGYAYGKKASEKALYKEMSGQAYWSFVSGGDENLYIRIGDFIGCESRKHIEEFDKAYDDAKQRLNKEFRSLYCLDDGTIDWSRLVKAVSERKVLKRNTRHLRPR